MQEFSIEIAIFAVIFFAVIAAYSLGNSSARKYFLFRSFEFPRQSTWPGRTYLEYKNAQGQTRNWDVKLIKFTRSRRGRQYLLGLCEGDKFRNFRVDRIT